MQITDNMLLSLLWHIPRLKFELLDSFWKEDSQRLLNKSQERTLLAIHMFKNKSMTELSRMTGVEKGSFTHIVDKLENMNYIVRERDTEDKRRYVLKLTDDGIKYYTHLDSDIKHFFNEKFSALTLQEREEFFNACNTVVSAMEKILSF